MDRVKAITRLRKFYKVKKRLPSYQEMADLFGFASKFASLYLAKKLIEEGVIEKDEKGKLIPKNLFAIPHLGVIRAGRPIPGEEQKETLDLSQYFIGFPESTFALTVHGDSMSDAGILEGDIIVADKEKEVRDGDIVVACIDNEWTVKFFSKKNGGVSLIPANPEYQIIYPKENLIIGGVVINVIRKYR